MHAFPAQHRDPRTGHAGLLVARRIPAASARLWLVELDATAAAIKAQHPRLAARWLTRSDIVRLARIRDRSERDRRAATYIALRILVAGLLGRRHALAPMIRPLGGKPRLAGVPIAFNLSHSGAFGLIGIARRGHVGVDMEDARSLPMTPRNRTRLVEAARALGRSTDLVPDRDRDVLQAWTRLEAFSKATGRGINRTLADFGIRKQADARLHTPGATIAERAARQLPRYETRDLALPLGIRASLARGL
ncbi:MAG: hypothetical protein NW223_05555 [Hyphomicrobiaceae bacterium]|nr:hypothetical protein [Hyphomicrobiaceae bacterium]